MTFPEYITGLDKGTLAVVLFVSALVIVLIYSVVERMNNK